MPSIITVASDARLGPPRVARRLNGFDSEIDYTLEALKVVEVRSRFSRRGGDTVATSTMSIERLVSARTYLIIF